MSIYKSKHLRPLWVACALQGFATWTPAQNQTSALPDPAAELRRLDERVQAQRQREEKGVDVTSPAAITSTARIPVGESPCFPIHHLQLIQDGSLAPTAMRPMWEPNFTWALRAIAGPTGDDSPMGKCLGAQGVALVIQRAQDSVLARGYVTINISAANNATIEAATSSGTSSSFYEKSSSGFGSGGPGISFGDTKQNTDQNGTQTRATGSTVGSIGGNISIKASNTYTQTCPVNFGPIEA